MRITLLPADDEATLRRARRRFNRRQWARRWLVWRRLLVGSLALLLIGVAAWLVFFSSALAVSGVSVEGASALGVHQVRRAASVPTGTPLARVDLDAITARVEDLAAVESVQVSRSWPDTVRIDVRERVAVAVVSRDGVFRALDKHGVIFGRFTVRPSRLPLVHVGAATRSDTLAEAARVIRVLPGSLASRIDYLEAGTIDTISLRMRNGRTIVWGSAEDSINKAKVIDVLLRHKATTYDVSVPGQPTLKK